MTQTRKERIYWTAAITALVITLVILAVLQFRWSRELDEAASTRMRTNLQSSMMSFRIDLARELTGITQALQVEPGTALSSQAADYAHQLQQWQRSVSHPELVSSIYVVSDRERRLLRLDTRASTFEAVEWPASFASVKESGERISPATILPPSFARSPSPSPGQHGPPPFGSIWQLELQIPALVRIEIPRDAPSARPENAAADLVIVELNRKVLRDQILPELAERYFAGANGLDYDIAVINRGASNSIVFSSGSGIAKPDVSADARINLFGPPFGMNGPPNHMEGRPASPPEDRLFERRQRGFVLRLEPFRNSQERGTWELVAKHRKGSLEAALASLRRQHLAISSGVLLLLSATVAMVIMATRRAQNLAQQQMDFVAGVSHELRTPLAVITSAAENIADGIVTSPAKVVQYGDVIRKHSRQLTQLVEQVLQFAAARNNSDRYNLAPARPALIIDTALYRSSELLSSGGFKVESDIAPDLPDIIVDAEAVCQCLQNLITNAIKYSGDSKVIKVSASESRKQAHEVRITIQDRGIGIPKSEIHRIFEPFYRSQEVVDAQIRGTGLGLALARRIAESMGGRLTVVSEVGKGSAFTLHLPVANAQSIDPSTLNEVSRMPEHEPENSHR